MHNVHSCVMGGSKWDSSRSLLFCFNDLLFHLVLKIRMEDLFRFFFSFRKCTCWQSIPLGYDLKCVTSSTAKLLNSSFNNNEIPHLPLEHFPPALPYWCCTSCFCGEREKRNERKNKMNESWSVSKIRSTSCLQSFSHFDLMWLEIQMMSSAFFIQYQDLSRPIHLLINTANVCRFNFSSSLSLFNFSLSDLPDLYFNYRLLISNHRGTGKRRPFNFSPYTMLNGSLQLEGGAKIYTKN